MTLRRFLAEHRLSVEEFAQFIRVNPQTLVRYMRRDAEPPASIILHMTLATGGACSAHELIAEFSARLPSQRRRACE